MVPWGQGGGAVTDLISSITSTTGAVIVRIRRVFYVFQGSVNTGVGAVEFTFADGGVVLLDSGSDGESLVISTVRWDDPFAATALSVENRDFIARSGKWSAFDVSKEIDYENFVGSSIEHAAPISASGTVTGATFRTSAGDLRVEVEADDLYVRINGGNASGPSVRL